MCKSNYLSFTKLTVLTVIMCFLSACSYGDDIDSLKNRVTNLEEAVVSLQDAFKEGKVITTVTPVEEGTGGYSVTFSDGTKIVLKNGEKGLDGTNGIDGADGKDGVDGANGVDGIDGANGADGVNGADGKDGKDGVTPIVKIDSEGYWIVSYDNGDTYTTVTDNNDNPVSALGSTEENGVSGTHGICVKVAIVNDKYVFQLYSPEAPDTIIESIETPYSANPANVLQSIVEDQNTGIISLTLANGEVFMFNLDVSYPTGIILLTDHVEITGKEHTATFEFRINPSNAFINFVFEGDDANIQLDKVATSRAGVADSYVTLPTNYRIIDVAPSLNEEGDRKMGQYTVTVSAEAQDVEGEEVVALVITTKDGRGNRIQLSSSLMTIAYDTCPQIYEITVAGIEATRCDANTFYVKLPYGTSTTALASVFKTNSDISVGDTNSPETLDLSNPVTITATLNGASKDYSLIAYYSNLPIMYVNTPAPVLSKEDWVKKSTIQIANAGEHNAIYEQAQLKGRGNSTWGYPKKPYAVKLDKKSEVLGMPKHKRWCLLANWMDRTNIRNEIALEIGRRMSGLAWSPRGKFVDLVFNGKFAGNYYVCEQIKIDPNRVNIDEMSESDVSGDNLTGGYLLELDSYFDEVNKFRTDILDLPVNFKDPDEDVLQPAQFEYVRNYFNDVESKLDKHSAYSEIEALLDIDSFIDWWLLQELTVNTEPWHPKSSYMYKARNGKLFAGPIWDYDWDTFREDCESWQLRKSIWYGYLFTYPEFVDRVKERWAIHKTNLSSIPYYIDEVASYVSESAIYDGDLWPITQSINGDEKLSFYESIAKMRKNYIKQFNWMDENIDKLIPF